LRIIVTDDQVHRYSRLIDALSTLGIDRQCVDIAHSANQAREYLERSQYDLLILDVLLPLWPEGKPDKQHSLDLLFELQETETLHKPSRIVGITADKDAADAVGPNFEDWTWTVVEYSDSNDEWVNRCLNCVRYIQKQVEQLAEKVSYGVDLAIVCALAEPELEEVLKLPWEWSSARPIDETQFVHDGWFKIGDRTFTVCAAASTRMGMISTALLSSKIITEMRPRLLAMCGICAGVKDKVNLGDVLLADPAWDFQSGKRVKDKSNKTFSIAPHQIPVSVSIRSHLEQIRADQAALAKLSVDFGSDAPGMTRVVIGPVASGSAVLADGDVIQEIRNQQRDLIGVEMEIYGMYAAAHSASSPQPHAFALKSVCDFADPDKKDKAQRYAAYASANVLRLLMERFGARLLQVH
jgi:nucleoside phosphorylase